MEAEKLQQMEDRIRRYEEAEKEWEAERQREAEKLRKMEDRARRCEEEAFHLRKRLWPDEEKKSHSNVRSSTVHAQTCSVWAAAAKGSQPSLLLIRRVGTLDLAPRRRRVRAAGYRGYRGYCQCCGQY